MAGVRKGGGYDWADMEIQSCQCGMSEAAQQSEGTGQRKLITTALSGGRRVSSTLRP